MTRLADAVLGTDVVQRLRLAHILMAMAIMLAGLATLLYFMWAGHAAPRAVAAWTAASLAGMVVVYAAVRSGWSRRFEDPSLTMPQMVYALACAAAAYALLGAGRGAVFPVVMVILMFGMFIASPRQMRWVSAYAVALFGATMAAMSRLDPPAYPAGVEIGHFLIVATMVPAASILAARLSQLRQRSRRQRQDLERALERIRELATRDELTGLFNRRQMRELMEQEHQRGIRSGRAFCVAVLDIDRFKAINEEHGRSVGDAVLRSIAHEATRRVRVADVLARWGGDRFVLLLADARAPLARGGVERVRAAVAATPIAVPGGRITLRLSAGLAEHRAGETVEHTLQRADRALSEAKAQGRDRLVVAA